MTIAELLNGHPPHGEAEAADLGRALDLLNEPDPWDRATPLHFTGSAVIVHPPTRRVLLRWHRRQGAWLQVGGHADPGETDPLAVAVREAEEETGLKDLLPWPGPRLVHLVIVPVTANAVEPVHEHADLRFVLATGDPESARPERPDAPLRWTTIDGAYDLTGKPNLRETLSRVSRLLDCG